MEKSVSSQLGQVPKLAEKAIAKGADVSLKVKLKVKAPGSKSPAKKKSSSPQGLGLSGRRYYGER